MNKTKLVIVIILLLAALFFTFGMTGHRYFAAALLGLAFLIVFYSLAGGALRTVVSVILCLGIILFITAEAPIIRHSRTDAGDDTEYLIVLGAGVKGTVPSLSLRNRMDGAYNWLKDRPGVKVILSGGRGPGEDITEARAMQEFFLKKGFAPERLHLEEKSTSTKENLENSLEIVRSLGGSEKSRIAVCTSEYHLFRTRLLAKDAGMDIRCVSAPTTMLTLKINYFIREAFGIVHYYVIGQ